MVDESGEIWGLCWKAAKKEASFWRDWVIVSFVGMGRGHASWN